MGVNEKYYGYGSTMSFILFDRNTNRLHSVIDSKISNSYLKSASLSQSHYNLDILSLYYSKTNYLIIFDIQKESMKNNFTLNNEILYQEYNKNNYLMILFENNTLGLIKNSFALLKNENDKNVEILQIFGKCVIFQWYPFCGLDQNSFCYCNTDNEVYYIDLNVCDKKYESKISLNNKIKEYKNNNGQIIALQWYISDENYRYILIGFDTSDICLCDMSPNNTSIITKFEKSGKNLHKLIWIKDEPGLFMAFYKNSSKICIFNVSSPNVKSITKFTEKNIINCCLLSNPYGSENKLLIALTDGNLILYDLNNKIIEKNITKGHSSTIFDLKFSPFYEGTLATCSIDCTIKIWNIFDTKKNITLMSSNRGVIKEENKTQIISIKWCPIEESKDLLLCGDSKNTIKIWDIIKQKVISQLELKLSNDNTNMNKLHKNLNVIGLDWNEENIILATCNTFIFIINYTANKLILDDIINLHLKVYKIQFSPYPKEKENLTFSVGCSDGKIRLYEISKIKKLANVTPTKTLSGHLNQVFCISYKPLSNKPTKDNNNCLLASGGDDYLIGIWDLTQQNPKVKFLLGHTDKIRNVTWFKNDNLLISGSWDGIAFIWDINYYICLSIINKHKSDIYGIDTNIKYPYMFATSSRDCSICIFNYINNPIQNILLYRDTLDNNFNLIKERHPQLYNQIKNSGNDNISKAEIISKYFISYPCLKELYDILRIIMKKNEHSTDNNKIFHLTDLYSAYKSKILKVEFDYNNNINNFNQNDINKNVILEAIIKCATINDWEKFCELNILINNWQKAIMFAPKVSQKYWENLIIRYNKYLKNEKDENNTNFFNNKLLYNILESSFTKDIKEPYDILMKEKEYKNILLLYLKNIIDKNNTKENYSDNNILFDLNEEDNIIDLINKIKDNEKNDNFLELMNIINLLVKEKIIENKLIEAVCILLSVNQIILAIKLLIRLDENELAFYLMDITQNYLYEDIISINILKNSLKLNNYQNHISFIKICKNNKIKLYLYKLLQNSKITLESKEQKEYEELIKNYKNNSNNENEINIFINLEKNYNEYINEVINKYFDILLCEIYDENIKYETLKNINEIFNILRLYNFNYNMINISKKILLIIIFFETLNKNCFAVKLLVNYFFRLSKIEDINELGENEKIIISLGNDLYKNVYNESLFNINFNLHSTLKKDVNIKMIQNNYEKNIKDKSLGNVNTLNRFNCDLENKFYLINSYTKNKIFEMNKYIQIIDDLNI